MSASDAAEHGPAGADAVGRGQRGEQRLGVDGLLDALAAGDGGEGVGGEAVAGGALAPRGDEVVGGGVLLGGAGAQHDVLDLAGMRAAADLGFELGQGVVDLGAALRELADDLVGDAVDLPAAGAAGPPPHPERLR